MNVHSNPHANLPAAPHATPRDRETFAKAPEEIASRWDTTDTVEISNETKMRCNLNIGAEPDPLAVQERRERIGYSAGDVAELKQRFTRSRNNTL